MYPEGFKYSKTHQWVKAENKNVKVGITDYAQRELGNVVFAELPRIGDKVEKGRSFGVVESAKAASDIVSPVTGIVVQVNRDLSKHPEAINEDPYETGWMIMVKMDNPEETDSLLSSTDYEKIAEQSK